MEVNALRARLRRSGMAMACLAAAALPLAAQTFTESADVVAVEVPVQVLKDGEPVRGLTAADFEIYEGRRKLPLTGFEVLDLTAVPAAAPAAPAATLRQAPPPSARRHFVLLFDLTFTTSSSLVKARKAAKDLLSSGLHPTDLVAVATYSTSRGPELLLGFSSDRRQAEAALDRLGVVDRAADPLRLVLPPSVAVGGAVRDGGGHREATSDGGGGGGGGADPNLMLNAASERASFDVQQRDVAAFSRAVGGFAKLMGSIHGRKYVVFLSEGFNNRLLLGSDDDSEIQTMNEASASGQFWKVNSDVRYGNTKLSGDIEKMIEELRRADCVVQSVDPAGLRAFGGENGVKPASGQDSLFAIANGTGGEMYNNFNDLSVAMKEMLKRTSVTYVLSYQPEGVKHDGTYRKLRVELKNAPRGTRVVYRPGYYAPLPFNQQTHLEKMLDAAGRVVNGEEGGTIATSVLAASFAAPGDKAYVPVLIEVDGKSLLATRQGNVLPLEIYTYAMDAAGTVRDYFAKTIGLDLAKVEPVLQKSGIKFYGDLSLPPGSYSLRVLVRNGATGALSARVVPVAVPVFSQPSTVLLQTFFPEAPGRWLIVRKTNEAPKDIPYPFQMRSEPYVPAARPVLLPGTATRVSLIGYHLGPGVLKAGSRVLRADGQEAGEGEIRLAPRQSGAAGEPDRLEATFRPPALQPGEYLLLLTLTDAAGKAETSTSSFVVEKGAHG